MTVLYDHYSFHWYSEIIIVSSENNLKKLLTIGQKYHRYALSLFNVWLIKNSRKYYINIPIIIWLHYSIDLFKSLFKTRGIDIWGIYFLLRWIPPTEVTSDIRLSMLLMCRKQLI